MARCDAVLEAVARWLEKGLIDDATAAELRAETEAEAERSGRKLSRYALAVAGGLVLLVAAGVLADLLWPLLDRPLRSLVLALTGAVVHAAGVHLETRGRWLPVAWVLQTAGLLVLLGAFLHSESVWPDATAGGIFVGLVALAAPLITAPRALGRNVVMPAVHLALAPAFLAVFLDRATTMSANAITWTLDAALAVAVVVLVVELGRAVRLGAGEEELDARLHAFTVALYAGLVLTVLTALGPLGLDEDTAFAVDAWWAGVTALTLWAVHRAPLPLRRSWFRKQLAASVLIAVPLVFWTCLDALGWGYSATSLTLGLVGGAGIYYALRTGFDGVLKASALAVVVAAWYLGVEAGGAVGAFAALAFTAGLLFWLSIRLADEAPEHP